jgi:hypothetical protein
MMKRSFPILSATIVLVVVLSSCTSTEAPASIETKIPAETLIAPTEEASPPPVAQPFELTSPAFEDEGVIPAPHSCHGGNDSPPLAWGTPPSGTQSFVLVMDDPDAEQVVGMFGITGCSLISLPAPHPYQKACRLEQNWLMAADMDATAPVQ